ncbi:hypothetical protein C0993_008119, partial [Termitomyces sp. T159_Od127]
PPSGSEAATASQNMQDINILPNARIHGPIPDNFDFDGEITLPDGIICFELPLAVHICENVEIKEFNNNSILKTIGVKDTSAPKPDDMDIGPPLRPLYYYVDDKVHNLIDSKALCALLAPLPAALLREIVSG